MSDQPQVNTAGNTDAEQQAVSSVTVENAAAVAALLLLEKQAIEAVSGPLRKLLSDILRVLAGRYVLMFGGLDRPAADPVQVQQLTELLVTELQAVAAYDPTPQLQQFAAEAAARGLEYANRYLTDPVAPNAVELPSVLTEAIGAVPGAMAESVASTENFVEQLPITDWDDLVRAMGKANQAATSLERSTTWAVNKANSDAIRQVAVNKGASLLWIAEADACVVCAALSGHIIDPMSGDGFDEEATFGKPGSAPDVWPPGEPLMGPPRHVNCLPGDALVTSSSRVTGASSRVYDGELVEIRTFSQKVFAATPNHPVLTDRGWVPIGALHQGGYVVSTVRREGVLVSDDHDQNVPTRIEDVAEAFLSRGQVLPVEVPLSAEDFHGDGVGSQVAVVGTDRLLRRSLHPSLCQQHSQVPFQVADVALRTLAAASAAQQFLLISGSTARRVMGRLGQPLAFFRRGGRHADEHALAAVAGLDSGFEQHAAQRLAADVVGFGERLLAGSAGVSLDEIVEIRRYPFKGHVYNLETAEGWYIGNGIVTHNCRCHPELWFGAHVAPGGPEENALYNRPGVGANVDLPAALRREAKRSIVYGWSLPSESGAVRLDAAQRLLARGAGLPRSVEERGHRAVAKGAFDNRIHPSHRRAVRR